MAEILFHLRDRKQPTIQEWRERMNDELIPQARAWLTANPYTEVDFTRVSGYVQRTGDYRWAIRQLERHAKGEIVLKQEQYTQCVATVAEWEASPVTQIQLDEAKFLLADRPRPGMPEAPLPSIEEEWRYWKNLLDVEAVKTDEVKDTELRIKERRGSKRRGDFWNIKKSGWRDNPNWPQSSYAEHIAAGRAGLLVCDEISDEEIPNLFTQMGRAWKDDFGYEILTQNAQQGQYTVRIFEQNPGSAGQNNLTATKIQSFLEGWGCTGIIFAANSCQFTFDLWNAVRSKKFWDYDVSNIIFSLISYSAQKGTGRISADFSAIESEVRQPQKGFIKAVISNRRVEERITSRGGTVISWSGRIVTFGIERSVILQNFWQDVKGKAEQIYICRRHAMMEEAISAVIATGGILHVTRAQVMSWIRDKATE